MGISSRSHVAQNSTWQFVLPGVPRRAIPIPGVVELERCNSPVGAIRFNFADYLPRSSARYLNDREITFIAVITRGAIRRRGSQFRELSRILMVARTLHGLISRGYLCRGNELVQRHVRDAELDNFQVLPSLGIARIARSPVCPFARSLARVR